MAGYDLSEALERLTSAENDADIRRVLDGLKPSEYRLLDWGAENEYGSDVIDLLQEPDMDLIEWRSLIVLAIRNGSL